MKSGGCFEDIKSFNPTLMLISFLIESIYGKCFIIFCQQHFVCAKCEKPFYGHRYYERKGLAYCETHYNEVW